MGNSVARGLGGRVSQENIGLGVVFAAIGGIAVVGRHLVPIFVPSVLEELVGGV